MENNNIPAVPEAKKDSKSAELKNSPGAEMHVGDTVRIKPENTVIMGSDVGDVTGIRTVTGIRQDGKSTIVTFTDQNGKTRSINADYLEKGAPDPEYIARVHEVEYQTYSSKIQVGDTIRFKSNSWKEFSGEATGVSTAAGVVVVKFVDKNGDTWYVNARQVQDVDHPNK